MVAFTADVDDRVRRAADVWGLTVGEALAGGSRSAVFAASDEAGRDLVLKLPPARDDGRSPAALEAAALSTWSSTRAAVTLVDATADALLLVRARPGRSWPWQPTTSLQGVVSVASDLLTRLWAQPPGEHRFPTLADVYPEDERVAREDAAVEQRGRREPRRGVPGLRRLPAAAVLAGRLIATCEVQRLLHGDFITKNLVSDEGSPAGWVALDPLPRTGDPAAEVGAFAAYHPVELILPTAGALARRLDVDPDRSLRWAAVWTVHQAAQAWRDDQRQLDDLVTSATLDDLLAV
ncbi:streptomycin 6-kinase [Friedmanniella luteola]|uniref:Streptomycin 6-kinase n=1 Tax=Friedmanniella luteola TaxID=546871 RepID=A0A1H1TBY8_9ACTN|nr:aminoglycoside phosphotransferase family protein [Friedmanniella luteola]SDS57664.1 streptomycin 6-kinase [Friedmanniella luteola]